MRSFCEDVWIVVIGKVCYGSGIAHRTLRKHEQEL